MKLRFVKPIQGVTALFVILFIALAIIAAVNGHLWLAGLTVMWSFVGAGMVYWEEILLAAEEDNRVDDPL